MNIISWLIFGLVVGIIANIIDPHPSKGGVPGSIILGILGAFLGGFLGTTILGIGITGFNFTSIAVAVLGALLLMFAERAMGKT